MGYDNRILPVLDVSKVAFEISTFIENSLIESNAQGLVVGLSGGLDSSVTAKLCAEVVNKDKILGLIMPSQSTNKEDINDAVNLAEELGIKHKTIQVDPLIEPVQKVCSRSVDDENYKLAGANLKARMRMLILYYHANALNRLVAGTGNRTELLVGYFTKYGDGGVDILPIGGLYKTDVRKLAEHLEIPDNIQNKDPTAGLWPGQTDEDDLGIKYELLDEILYLMAEKGMEKDEIAQKLKISLDEVVNVKLMVRAAEHKLKMPPMPPIVR
ncbi:NAD+ synthase [Methanobacterium petrolearium]|uniref:NAD+ synthase n=1 Tax=Methanobacterium petrolearium TaxID=710190 RepID=UPI001AE5C082|nr:NAD+ synthase [Methanobacterium petrolearium]MBP1944924.1 NAD+ synthase [Methanobacterium petrolearium]BDZ70237.1 NAD(+) synthetase [Methanobacterium petrolearium]